MKPYELTPTEAWQWITSGVAVGAMTDGEVSAAKGRTNELFGEVNSRLDKEVTAKELIGGLDQPDISEFFYRLWPSAVKEAREEFSGTAPWQSTRNEWSEKQLGKKPEIPKLPDEKEEIKSLLESGDIERKGIEYISVTEKGKKGITDILFNRMAYEQRVRGYSRNMADRMELKLSYFQQHKEFVERAITDGKAVPEKVLNDYKTI